MSRSWYVVPESFSALSIRERNNRVIDEHTHVCVYGTCMRNGGETVEREKEREARGENDESKKGPG